MPAESEMKKIRFALPLSVIAFIRNISIDIRLCNDCYIFYDIYGEMSTDITLIYSVLS